MKKINLLVYFVVVVDFSSLFECFSPNKVKRDPEMMKHKVQCAQQRQQQHCGEGHFCNKRVRRMKEKKNEGEISPVITAKKRAGEAKPKKRAYTATLPRVTNTSSTTADTTPLRFSLRKAASD